MKKKLIISALFALLITGCSTAATNNSNSIKNFNQLPATTYDYKNMENKADMSAYDTLKDKNPAFQYMNLEQFSNSYISEQGIQDGVYYFCFDSCPYCSQAVPVLNYVLKQNNMVANYINIYSSRFDSDGNKDEHGDTYYANLQKFLDKYLEDDKVVYAPTVVFVKDGNIKKYVLGLETSDDYNAHESDLSNKQQNHLATVYQKGIKEIK